MHTPPAILHTCSGQGVEPTTQPGPYSQLKSRAGLDPSADTSVAVRRIPQAILSFSRSSGSGFGSEGVHTAAHDFWAPDSTGHDEGVEDAPCGAEGGSRPAEGAKPPPMRRPQQYLARSASGIRIYTVAGGVDFKKREPTFFFCCFTSTFKRSNFSLNETFLVLVGAVVPNMSFSEQYWPAGSICSDGYVIPTHGRTDS